MFYKRLIINGEEYLLAVNQTGQGAPTESTVGEPGLLYMDTDTGEFYKCTAAADGVYTWEEFQPSRRRMMNFEVIENGNTITLNYTLEGGEAHTDVINFDENGYPVSIVADGFEATGTWTVAGEAAADV